MRVENTDRALRFDAFEYQFGQVIARKLRRRLALRRGVAGYFVGLRGLALAIQFKDEMLNRPGSM